MGGNLAKQVAIILFNHNFKVGRRKTTLEKGGKKEEQE